MSLVKNLIITSLAIITLTFFNSPANARGFRVGLLPNGSQNNCANCHNNAGGGGPRNVFGEDVAGLVSRGGREEFWSLELALEDSDEDGFTNGEELGDLNGDGTTERTVNISFPGDPNNSPIAAVGDCNLDTELNGSDLACVSDVSARDAILEALNSLPGDLDGNGSVAFADFLILSANFSSDVDAYTDGDIDLNGSVDFADFLVLSNNFGQSGEAAASAVPEPSGATLGLFAVFAIALVRRSRRQQS